MFVTLVSSKKERYYYQGFFLCIITTPYCPSYIILHMLNELGVEEGEARELVLVEVHHEQLVGGCEFCALTGELAVKV